MSGAAAPSRWARISMRLSGSAEDGPATPSTVERSSDERGRAERADDTVLRDLARETGCLPVAAQGVGDIVTVHGELRTVTIQPRRGARALEAVLYDGTGSLALVWLGRCRIPGISAGRTLTATGRLGDRDGERVLYNPRYELSR